MPTNQFVGLAVNYIKKEEEIGIAGYRVQNVFGNAAHQGYLWKNKDQKVEGKFLYHKLSTFSGNSGSPIFVKRGDRLFAVAIHKAGLLDGSYNVARIITEDVLFNLMFWQTEMCS